MNAFIYLLWVLFLACGSGLLLQLVAATLQRPLPRVTLGLYRAAGLRQVPHNKVAAFIGFSALFLVTGLLYYWMGLPAGYLLLLWISYQLLRVAASPT